MNHQNHTKLEETQPMVMDEIYEPKDDSDEEYNDRYCPSISNKDWEYMIYQRNIRNGTYQRVQKARETLQNIPSLKGFEDPESWKTRTNEWEFKKECNYEIAFTKEQCFVSIVYTDYPRLEVNVKVEGNNYYPRYFAPNIVLGAILDCILKKPLSSYIISNRNYYITNDILDKTLQELYERNIPFRNIYVKNTNFFDRFFILYGCYIYPQTDEIPKVFDLEEDVSNGKPKANSQNLFYTRQNMIALHKKECKQIREQLEPSLIKYRKTSLVCSSTQTEENGLKQIENNNK